LKKGQKPVVDAEKFIKGKATFFAEKQARKEEK
jgi:hypothetical protein